MGGRIELADIITAKNLCLWYGDTKALKSINIAVPEHSITALIGPSGCGKSTFLKTLNRMNDLIPGVRITGDVRYEGKDIFQAEVNNLRKEVGMVFQKPNPFPMSIYDNIAYGPRTHGVRNKAKLDDIVERSLRGAAIWDEVKDRLKKNALGLSGGQQQRLCIARALAVEPDVLLMDEPTSALDPISTSKIEELAVELKEKYTIVIVTHNMQQAVRISDNTAFFLLGELVEYGSTDLISSALIILKRILPRLHTDAYMAEQKIGSHRRTGTCKNSGQHQERIACADEKHDQISHKKDHRASQVF